MTTMTIEKGLQLITGGKVTTSKGREFTRLIGGFDDNNSSITDKQVAELLGYKDGARHVRRQVNENTKYFDYEHDIKDFKRAELTPTLIKLLVSLGYAKQSITQAENIYLFSKAGFLLFLKFAEGDKSVELYKDFIEDYFQKTAENIIMKQTLQEELAFLLEQKIIAVGRVICEPDEAKKIEWFQDAEKLNTRIKDIEITLSNEKLVKSLQPELALATTLTDARNAFDVGVFSKVLRIKDLGRNNMFAWLREMGILMEGNYPFQQYLQYFKVLPIENPHTGRTDYKTLIKPNGVKYIVKKLIEDGKMVTKSVSEILAELDAVV